MWVSWSQAFKLRVAACCEEINNLGADTHRPSLAHLYNTHQTLKCSSLGAFALHCLQGFVQWDTKRCSHHLLWRCLGHFCFLCILWTLGESWGRQRPRKKEMGPNDGEEVSRFLVLETSKQNFEEELQGKIKKEWECGARSPRLPT